MARFTLVVLFVFLSVCLAGFATAQIEVRQDGNGDHTTINAALAAAGFGATIEITDDGVYNEDLTLMVPGMTLRAARYRFPVVTPQTTTTGSIHCLIGEFGITVKGIAFDGSGSDGNGLVIAAGVAAVTLDTCRVANYRGLTAHGLHVAGGGQFGITIRDCRCENNNRGLTIDQVESSTVDNTLVYAQSSVVSSVAWGVKAVSAPSGLGFRHCTFDTDGTGPCFIFDIQNLINPTPGGDIVGFPLFGSGPGMVYMSNSIVAHGVPNLVLTGDPLGVNLNCFDSSDAVFTSLPGNNIFGDPMFRNVFDGNFDIDIFSPCRNTASVTYTDELPNDIQGTCRFIGGPPDRGCYEATGANCLLDWEWVNPNLIFHLKSPPGLYSGKDAIFLISHESCPGIPIPFGRLPLAFGDTLAFGLDPANAFLFAGMNGTMGPSGEHTGTTFIPPSAQAFLSGASFYCAYVILEPGPGITLLGHSIATFVVIP